MSDTVITVDSLSKAYKIGLRERHGKTFREAFADTVLSPLRRLKSVVSGGNGSNAAEETFWALKDVSFEVKRGEVVGIIGRNGAGKSTLLKILSRITEPTSGEVRLRGRVASLLEVGTGFHPELTGRENIYLNGAILGMKRAEITRKFDEIVAFAEVEKFLDTPVKRYSSGMYVRLAFAVAAHLEPEILIVDEVLAVGDAEFQKKCLGKMQDVAKGEGRTVLFVSHNMNAIEQLCTCGIVLSQGGLTFFGSADAAVIRYNERICKSTAVIDGACGAGFHVTKAGFNLHDDQPVRSFGHVMLSLILRSEADVHRIGVRVFVEALSGRALGDFDSYPAHNVCGIRAGRLYELVVDFASLPLRPGNYRLRVELRDDSRFAGFELPFALSFTVEPSLDPKLNSRFEDRFGPVAFACRTETIALDTSDVPHL